MNDLSTLRPTTKVSHVTIADLFLDARSQNGWLARSINDEQLAVLLLDHEMGTDGFERTTGPDRLSQERSGEAAARPRPCAPQRPKSYYRPVVAIIGYDTAFHSRMDRTFPHNPAARENYANNPSAAATAAFRNGSIQGGYFIIAARALGLDAGPMSGFKNDVVDAEFFDGTTVKSNFLCALGHGDPTKLFPRNPRLDFEDVCQIL